MRWARGLLRDVFPDRRVALLNARLAPLRRRALLAEAARSGLIALGRGGLAMAVVATLAGPLPTAWMVGVAWLVVALTTGWAVVSGAAALRRVLGVGAASLFSRDRALASSVRSAWELGLATPPGASPDLVRAHQASVLVKLGGVRPASVVPFPPPLDRTTRVAAAALAVAMVALASGRTRAGLFALTHPGAATRAEAPTAAVVESLDARIVYPTYLGREPLRIPAATRIEAPVGSTLELRVVTRIAARRVEIAVGDHRIAASRDGQAMVASFLVEADAPIRVLAHEASGRVVRDADRRAVHAVADPAPTVQLVAPETDRTIDLDDAVLVAFSANDDIGVVDADLVITMPDGHEQRRRLQTATPPTQSMFGDSTLDPGELGAAPGDTIRFRVEAHDGNDVTGPGVGRSDTRTLVIASESTRRQEAIQDLANVRDAALGALADRLEVAVPDDDDDAQRRFEAGAAQIASLVSAIGRLSLAARLGETARTDQPVYAGMISRLRRVLATERRGIEPRVAAVGTRTAADRAVRVELENDVIVLTDMLARARVEDAAAIARELEGLRREIASLLRELARAPTDEARAALLTAIGRAEQRLTELRARLAAMGTGAPQEFANVTEEAAEATQAALDSMREGLLAGDLDAATRALTSLEQEIDGIARALGQGEASFAQEHFGARDRALAEAMDALQGLEAEERELSTGSTNARAEAARAAIDAMGDRGAARATELAESARAAAATVGRAGPDRLAATEREERARAQQRLQDVADALAAGDLGEAAHMAEEAEAEADALARDLSLDAMMFGGHEGEMADGAREATEAARQARDLRARIDRAIPDLAAHMTDPTRRALREGAPRQTAAADSASRLADRFEHGPDGEPLMPDVGGEVREIRGLLLQAADARAHEEPAQAAETEAEAARRLAELRQRIEQDAQHQRGDGGGGASANELGHPVEIPEDHEGPMELRRRLLDAMSEGAPHGYDDSVRRYYEGLLR